MDKHGILEYLLLGVLPSVVEFASLNESVAQKGDPEVSEWKNRVNIYVGNISYNTSEDDLRDLFARYGEVSAVRVITDRDTGRSKGFGFVEMSDDTQAKEAIGALDSNDFMGRDIRVNEARPREPR